MMTQCVPDYVTVEAVGRVHVPVQFHLDFLTHEIYEDIYSTIRYSCA